MKLSEQEKEIFIEWVIKHMNHSSLPQDTYNDEAIKYNLVHTILGDGKEYKYEEEQDKEIKSWKTLYPTKVYCRDCRYLCCTPYWMHDPEPFCTCPKNRKDTYYTPNDEYERLPELINCYNDCGWFKAKLIVTVPEPRLTRWQRFKEVVKDWMI